MPEKTKSKRTVAEWETLIKEVEQERDLWRLWAYDKAASPTARIQMENRWGAPILVKLNGREVLGLPEGDGWRAKAEIFRPLGSWPYVVVTAEWLNTREVTIHAIEPWLQETTPGPIRLLKERVRVAWHQVLNGVVTAWAEKEAGEVKEVR